MGETAIEWTERTWNPIVGCSLQSPGCTRCYAMKMAGRLEAMGVPYCQGTTQKTKNGFVWTGKIAANDNALMEPLRRRAPTMWFVNSMSDLFHEDVSEQAIDRVFVVMALNPQHTFQVLTKRADRMRAYVEGFNWERAVENCRGADGSSMILKHNIAELRRLFGLAPRFSYDRDLSAWPLPNAWKGVSVEDQKRADLRIPDLLATPAAIRWLSCEPLLGPVDLRNIPVAEGVTLDAMTGYHTGSGHRPVRKLPAALNSLDWVVVGGESGPDARPMHPAWARSIREQCSFLVAFFFKQWGNWISIYDRDRDDPDWRDVPKPGDWNRKRWLNRAGGQGFHGDNLHMMRNVGKKAAGRELDGRTHDDMPSRSAA
ncbi:phage Gp37/Gp68 family protein [Sphingobium xenophagum]|uniref:phage Gp37/Gp68 family protein n=1 Tax=Sphingobium xenophagum TaxID=121428 RepID=UPI00039A8965|nr:phage Gp37/Gp68 family protein [Sphingobium xenophagum]